METLVRWLIDKNGISTLAFLFGVWSYWKENHRKAEARFNDLKPHFEIGRLRTEGNEWIVPIVNHGGLVVFVGVIEQKHFLDRENRRWEKAGYGPGPSGERMEIVPASERVTSTPSEFSVLPRLFSATLRFAIPAAGSSYSLLLVWRDADGNAFLHRLFVSNVRVTGNAPNFRRYVSEGMLNKFKRKASGNDVPKRRDCYIPAVTTDVVKLEPSSQYADVGKTIPPRRLDVAIEPGETGSSDATHGLVAHASPRESAI